MFLGIILRTLFMYFFIIFAYRLMGKKEVGQLSIIDLIVSILIAELVALSIEGKENSILMSVVPIMVLVGVQIFISYITLKSEKIRDIIDGKPAVIIKNGRLNFTEMSKLRYSLDDLISQLRLQGVKSINKVKYVLDHPGGGSAQSLSYKPQKRIEIIESHMKPKILLIGHYHKSYHFLYRNIQCIQVPALCGKTSGQARTACKSTLRICQNQGTCTGRVTGGRNNTDRFNV